MKTKQLLLAAMGATLFTACIKDKYDLENLEVEYNPAVALPLISTEVKTSDLLKDIDTTLISAGSDNVLTISYADTLKSITLAEIVGNKSFTTSGTTVLDNVIDANTKTIINGLAASPIGDLPAQDGLPGGEHSGGLIAGLDSVTFSSADLDITMTNNTPIDMSNIKMAIKSIKNGVVLDTVIIPLVAKNGGSATGTATLSNKVLTDSISIDMFSFGTPGGTNAQMKEIVNGNYQQTISFATDLKNPVIQSFYGDLSGESIPSSNENIDFTFSDDPLLNSFKLADPVVNIYFENGFGVPFELTTLDLTMKGGSSTVPVTGHTVPKIAPATIATPIVTTQLSFDGSTNIADALNSQPKQIAFGVAGNVDASAPKKHFATDQSTFMVRMDVDVPVYGKLQNMVVLDTIDLEGDVFENLLEATLRSTITNDFPLDGNIQFLFADGSYNVLDSLVQAGGDGLFMQAAPTNAQGVGTTATEKTTDFVLKEATLKKLSAMKYAIVVAKVSSGNNGNDVMKILSTYNMKIKLGIIAKIKAGDIFSSED